MIRRAPISQVHPFPPHFRPVFDGPSGYDVANQHWASEWRPPVTLSTAEWAAKFRRLSAKTGAEPGVWRNERIPYLRAIMDALDERHPAPLVVFVKSSQVGGSECGLNWIGRTIHQKPRSFLALFPSEKNARKWIRTRLNPMLKETPELRRIIPPGRRGRPKGDDEQEPSTLTEKHYPGGVLFTGSANIAEDVASISVPCILLDERDRMAKEIEDEGDPVELAKRRAANFTRRKIFEISTPTTEDGSGIWPDWLSSTMDRYHVPCPDCGEMQVLRFSQLKWPEGRPHEARYSCEECGSLFEERHKTDMLERGRWIPEHPEREAHVKGFHINALYSPIGLGETWGDHAAAHQKAKGNPRKMQVWTNTRAGEVVKSEKEKMDWRTVSERREPVPLRTIPPGYLILTCGVDVQSDRLEAQIIGWGRGERSFVVDYQMLLGDPLRDEVWALLDDYLAKEIRNSFGIPMRVKCTIVDSGYAQHEVTNYTRTRGSRNIFAGKGAKKLDRQPIGRPTKVDVRFRGQVAKRGAEQYQLGVGVLKSLLYRRLASDGGTPEEPILPADRFYRFSDQLPEEYFRQLCAEEFDPMHGWIKVYDRNEALDTMNLATAAAMHHSVNLHKLRAIDWEQYEATLQPADRGQTDADATSGLRLPSGSMMPSPAKVKR